MLNEVEVSEGARAATVPEAEVAAQSHPLLPTELVTSPLSGVIEVH